MVREVNGQTIRLDGFNNLTKNLSLNIFDVCYAKSAEARLEYLEYVDATFSSSVLRRIIEEVTKRIDATLLHTSTQDFDPRGASATALIAEGAAGDQPAEPLGQPQAIVGHLNKSHIAAHTYPESHPDNGIATFRVDIDVGTCGLISPLSALDFLIGSFDSDVVHLDYRVRGFTRDAHGRKHFIDHDMSTIQAHINDEILAQYRAHDANDLAHNIFHTRLRRQDFAIEDYLFGDEAVELQGCERERVEEILEREMREIFECQPGESTGHRQDTRASTAGGDG